MSSESVTLRGVLKGHNGWVTAISAPSDTNSFIVSSSRDKTVMVWDLEFTSESVGKPRRALRGHNHFVQDVTLSSDGAFALSASWDKTLRLWNLKTGVTHQRFVGHEADVLSVSFSPDNRQVVSASRDKTIRVWNILGECKGVLGNNVDGHEGWVSCVRFSPNAANSIVVSCGWDKLVKVWETNEANGVKTNHIGHTGYVNTVTVSPDGSLCASGGKDGVLMLWDLNEDKHLYSLEGGDIIHSLCFSPNRYWLCAATNSGIKIWDLESKMTVNTLSEKVEGTEKDETIPCLSLAWSHDGKYLFGGFADNNIRVYEVSSI